MSKLNPLTPDDEKAGRIGAELRKVARLVCDSAVGAGATNLVHAVLISGYGANGLVHYLAKSIRRGDADEPIKSTEVLMAALIAYHVSPLECGAGEVKIEFNPLVINSALVDFEKLTGRRPDDDLNPQMCQVAREAAADPQLLAEVAHMRAMNPDGLAHSRPSNRSLH